MSALFALFYYIVVPLLSAVVAWLWLRRAKSPTHKKVARALCALWFVWLAWTLVGGEKIWLDMKVDRLCAEDGGIKVYETVTLPPEKFDKWGVFYVPSERKMEKDDRYYYVREDHYFQNGDPVMWKTTHKIYRTSDRKLLGESIRYTRRGGDLSGPWSNSSYGCPEISKESPQIEKLIFIKGQ